MDEHIVPLFFGRIHGASDVHLNDTGDYVLLCSGLVLALQKVDLDQGILICFIIPSPIFYLLHLSRHVYFSDASDIEAFKIS